MTLTSRWIPSDGVLVERKFGAEQRQNVEELSKIKLKRKLLGIKLSI